jgi:GT2 family glycosyltransferase
MELSVAISTRDRPDTLARCLDALAAGTLLPAEVVIVDQSTGDETRSLIAARQGGPLRLVYVRQARAGLGASQNEAVRRARSAYIAVTDDDCVPAADWLASVARAFGSESPPDLVGGRVLPLPAVGERSFPVSSRTSSVARDFSGWAAPWHVGSGNNFAFARDWFLRIGGCDERLGPGSRARGGVDMDLFYRFARAGARLRYEPSILVYHERETAEGRRGRRPMYGRGMGACCGLRLREGDWHALRLFGEWLALRVIQAAKAARRRDWRGVREEASMVGASAGGVLYGLSAR